MSAKQPRVLLHGAGAIGICYLYILQEAGCDVTAVCRSNYEAAKEHGFKINSAVFGNDITVKPKVCRTVSEAASSGGPFDYIMITTKAFPSAKPTATPSTSAAAIGPAVTEGHTTIVLIQNGILIEDEYKAAYPSNTLLSCVVYLPTTQTSPAVVEMGNLELLEIGPYPSPTPATAASSSSSPTPPSVETLASTSPDLATALRFRDVIRRGTGTAHVYADVQAKRWKKLMLNCGWNPVCALSRSRDVAVLGGCDEAEGFVREVMLEVAGVAQKMGHAEVGAGMVEEVLGRAKERMGTKGIEPSMLADVREGRRMEVEAILGGVMRLGKEMGCQVVRLEAMYVLCRALDDRIAEG